MCCLYVSLICVDLRREYCYVSMVEVEMHYELLVLTFVIGLLVCFEG
jgi:hypothetical protein